MQWEEIEPGALQALLSGTPEERGSHFVIRYRTTQKIHVPPHHHPNDEHISVIHGRYRLGFGDVFDESALCEITNITVPAGVRHFAVYEDGTEIEVTGTGPFRTVYGRGA